MSAQNSHVQRVEQIALLKDVQAGGFKLIVHCFVGVDILSLKSQLASPLRQLHEAGGALTSSMRLVLMAEAARPLACRYCTKASRNVFAEE
jgi:hypothetical protein